jgi:hypothetical protein
MNHLEGEGLRLPSDAVDDIAVEAYALASGQDVADIRRNWSGGD